MYVPSIIEKTASGERVWDIFSRLVEDRIIYLHGEVDDNMATLVNAQLLYLNKKDPKKDIIIYINSPGGSVISGMSIYDTMQFVSNDIVTVGLGMAASMASVIIAAGTKGKRFILPHSEVMIHQPLSGVQGQASDIEIGARHVIATKKRMNQILAYHSGQPLSKVEKDTDRDNYLTAEQAVEYGLVDKVIGAYDLWKEIGAIE
ncbi:MAG: ATP-dependent Clp protease proteolytic subunit [Candidatus Absconditabacterales bacterium]